MVKLVVAGKRGKHAARKTPSTESAPVFQVGFSVSRELITPRNNRYLMSCFSCDHFFKGVEDDEEVCQNPNVLQYDMVVTDSQVYCYQWVMSRRKNTAKDIFRKGVSGGDEVRRERQENFSNSGEESR